MDHRPDTAAAHSMHRDRLAEAASVLAEALVDLAAKKASDRSTVQLVATIALPAPATGPIGRQSPGRTVRRMIGGGSRR